MRQMILTGKFKKTNVDRMTDCMFFMLNL
jgi:hypothetical protein